MSSQSRQVELAWWQYAALNNPFKHFAFFGGVATGKSFTLAQFVIHHVTKYPHLTGLIGANTYDQLSQATLRELLYWLDEYGYEYVIDEMPPPSWGFVKKKFKTYRNILSIKIGSQIAHCFVRILSDGDPLRGIELSWYALDEVRDTPEYTHDVILSRMRESEYVRGMIFTTTNGEDWAYKRFVRGNTGNRIYGSIHVRTEESVKSGIITKAYYDDMRASYSPLMAAQELDAEHVNIHGGRAYYSTGEWNRKECAPWGDEYPDPSRPLIIGCDFNYAPAPCIWMVGQVGEGEWEEHIHWFGEVAMTQASTPDMTNTLMSQFPGFFYRVFGDASGNRGTTSNAGETDYNQMAAEFSDAGCFFSIDSDQANPLVKKRVENLNARAKNALGQVRMTYHPGRCPNLDADFKVVGWKVVGLSGKGKLDNAGDVNRTHASDAAGYALLKLFPPGQRGTFGNNIASSARQEIVRAF